MPDNDKLLNWLRHDDLKAYLKTDKIPTPWFPLFSSSETEKSKERRFAALVPPENIPKLVQRDGWDIGPQDGGPTTWQKNDHLGNWEDGYDPVGTDFGIEPLVIWRDFFGIRPHYLELCQEFRLFHNLCPEPSKKRFIKISRDGSESEAARYDEKKMEVRSDLLLEFSAVKQMALAVYIESFRYSRIPLKELGVDDDKIRIEESGERYYFSAVVYPPKSLFESEFESEGSVIGSKKYILPGPRPAFGEQPEELHQKFVIGTDDQGKPIRHTCDPGQLSNYFGANPGAPNYLTPVFFRSDVLSKYYANPGRYEVSDGYLRCGSLWGVRIDNDHDEYVVVWLGDLGRDLSEQERDYWLSFNVAPDGKTISRTNFRRAFEAIPTNPERSDHLFKQEYSRFLSEFREAEGWDFFLPLHPDDEHYFTSLRLPVSDTQSEFDGQLLALTKVLIDSLNEKQLKKVIQLENGDQGITKLQKFLIARGLGGWEPHIKLLRVLQDLRSKSAAHRKGTSYDELIENLGMKDEGHQKAFDSILRGAALFIRFLRANLLNPENDDLDDL
jgi:hypothetical protein